jgi:hypothetical protein
MTIESSEPRNSTTSRSDIAWRAFVAAAREFALHLDQWEKIKFETSYGPVYVSISRSDLYPDSFSEIDDD